MTENTHPSISTVSIFSSRRVHRTANRLHCHITRSDSDRNGPSDKWKAHRLGREFHQQLIREQRDRTRAEEFRLIFETRH
jgi:hypothetical protein